MNGTEPKQERDNRSDNRLTPSTENPNGINAEAGWRRGYAADCKSAVLQHENNAIGNNIYQDKPGTQGESDNQRQAPSPRPLRVLIGCETSGIGRRAFAALGHDVWSCDLLPADDGSNRHIVCDIRDGILEWGWDLLAVMHPPCTRLCRSGRQWMSGPGQWTQPKRLPKGRSLADMRAEFDVGVSVFIACWDAPIARVAIENPVMSDLAKAQMPSDLPEPHMVQPFWFGHPEYKGTGWYLRGLPTLVETDRLPEPERGSDEWKAWNRVHRMPPGPERARLRSRSFPGMMAAAARQWGDYAMQQMEARK